MRKIFLTLLISLTLLLTLNPFIYSDDAIDNRDNSVKIDGRKITYSTRETSQGVMVELLKEDYKFILVTALNQKERGDMWEDRYIQLLEDTVFEQSYDKALHVINTQEEEIERKDKTIKILGISTGGLAFLLATSFLMNLR